jgi:predicted dehydrogenase
VRAASVGLVGCGRWGRNILRDLVALGARVAVVTLDDASRAEALALGAASWHRELAALPPQDGYLVATPTATHEAVVTDLLRRERPVFCEKPLGHDLAAARRIAALRPNRLYVMHKWRYHPGIVALRSLLAEGRLGRPLALQIRQLGWGNPHRDVDAATILLPHALSMTLHLLGSIPPLREAVALLPERRDGGIIARLAGNAGAPPRVLLEYSILQPVQRRSVVLIGSAATAELGGSYDEALTLRLGAPGAAAGQERLALSGEMPLRAEVAAFLDHLAGGPPPLSPLTDELAVAERLEEIRVAAGLAGG